MPASWDGDAQRWLGSTCPSCEKRRRSELSEEELAVYARDPFLSRSALRFLYNRRSPLINAALASRGVDHLHASLAADLGVDESSPVEPLVPYWQQYRADPPRPLAEAATVAVVGADTPAPPPSVALARIAAPAGHEPEAAAPSHRRRGLLVTAWAAAVVAALGAAAFLYLRDDDGEVATAPTTTLAPTITASSSPTSGVETTDTQEPARTTTPRTSAPRSTTPRTTEPRTTSPRPPVVVADAPTSTAAATTTTRATVPPTSTTIPTIQYVRGTLPLRWAEYADGIVYLRGRVPNQQTADEIRAIAAGVVGAENVRVEYVIDPTAPLIDGAPLYVRDAVPFDPDESAPGLEAYPVLDLGVVLLQQNPQMIVEIGGHTDDQGDAEYNLELSRQRASVVRDYLIEQGANPAQVVVRPYGETQPIAGNDTPEGREANRRIELSVFGLLS